MKSTLRSSLAVLCALGSVSAYALQPLNSDDAGTVGAGGNQLEFSVDRTRARESGESGRDRGLELGFGYTRGITETLDLSIATAHLRSHPGIGDEPHKKANGMGNIEIGAKWRFFENEKSGTSIALAPTLVMPTSKSRQNDLGTTGRLSGSLGVLLTQEVAFGSLNFNAGLGKNRFRQIYNDSGDPTVATSETTRNLSFAPIWAVTETFQLAADIGVEWAKANKSEDESGDLISKSHTTRTRFAGLGAIWTPHKDVDLAVGYFRARDNEKPKGTENSIRAGVTFRF